MSKLNNTLWSVDLFKYTSISFLCLNSCRRYSLLFHWTVSPLGFLTSLICSKPLLVLWHYDPDSIKNDSSYGGRCLKPDSVWQVTKAITISPGCNIFGCWETLLMAKYVFSFSLSKSFYSNCPCFFYYYFLFTSLPLSGMKLSPLYLYFVHFVYIRPNCDRFRLMDNYLKVIAKWSLQYISSCPKK